MLTVERALGPRRRCRVRCSDRADGDAGDPSFLGSERDRWSLPHQVHGAAVTLVSTPGEGTGGPVDALVTDRAGPVLAIRTADCVPIAVYGSSSVAAVHAGWKGLEAGVVEAAVAEMRRIDGGPPHRHGRLRVRQRRPAPSRRPVGRRDHRSHSVGHPGSRPRGSGRDRAAWLRRRPRSPGRTLYGDRRPLLLASGPARARAHGDAGGAARGR